VQRSPTAGAEAALAGHHAHDRPFVLLAWAFLDEDRVQDADLGDGGDQVREFGRGY
jgi:hypothetical protein